MPVAEINIGDRWGRLTCIDAGKRDRVWAEMGMIDEKQPYVALQCDCGEQFEVWVKDFAGKRKTKDCGCGMADDDTAYVVVALSLPLETRKVVKKIARQQGLKFSRAFVELVRVGIEYWDIKQNQMKGNGGNGNGGQH